MPDIMGEYVDRLVTVEMRNRGMNYGIVMAATALSTVPILIAFLIGQKQIIASLASSGLGGR